MNLCLNPYTLLRRTYGISCRRSVASQRGASSVLWTDLQVSHGYALRVNRHCLISDGAAHLGTETPLGSLSPRCHLDERAGRTEDWVISENTVIFFVVWDSVAIVVIV